MGKTMSHYDFNGHFWSHKEVGGGQLIGQKSQGVFTTKGLTKITGWLVNRRDRTSQVGSVPVAKSPERTH